MKTGIRIGNTLGKKSTKNLCKAISTILKVGEETGTSDEVLIKALDVLANISEVKNINISNTSIQE